MKTLESLKAQAYDCIAKVEFWQKNLKAVNESIANYKIETTSEVTGTPEVDFNNNKSGTKSNE